MTAPPDAAIRRRAADPSRSVLLEAPAGSGKTSLLVERYLNLLARVRRPEEILAITFTAKAADEMRGRVLRALAGDSPIAARIRSLDAERGWNLAERRDRLKMQTIDSFALGLARRLPISGGCGIERFAEDAGHLYAAAAERLLDRLAADDPLAELLADFVALLDNDATRARAFIAAALARRDQWIGAVAQTAGATQRVLASIAAGVAHLRDAAARALAAAAPAALRDALDAFGGERLPAWPGLGDAAGWQALGAVLLTARGTPRTRFTVREGFERRHAAEKARARELAAALGESGLAALLAPLRALPNAGVDAGAEQALRATAVALSLAVVELQRVFETRRVIDFAELTLAANRALGGDGVPTELALALDYRIRHILVDEFQDTSLGQHRLLAALVEGWTPDGGNTFFAVGDPMQSIYRFRDADLRLFLETAADGFEHLPLEHLRLAANFRSAKPLVDWCNDAFGAVFGRRADALRGAVAFSPAIAQRDAPGQVRCLVCVHAGAADARAQGVLAAERIAELRRRAPDESIALLVRARSALPDILDVLRERGARWRGTDIELLVDAPAVRDLESLACVLHSVYADPARAGARRRMRGEATARLAWLALLRSPLVGLRLADIEQAAAHDGAGMPPLSADGSARWRRLLDALARDARSLPPRARIENCWLALGGADAYASDSAIANAERFFDLLDAKPEIARRPADLRRELERLHAAETDAADAADADVMTIHRAKGLEFDHVIVPAMEHVPRQSPNPLLLWRPEGRELLIATRTRRGAGTLYDYLLAEEKARDDNERKRLFYVAATRAAKSLTLIGGIEEGDADGADSGDARPPKGSMLDLIWERNRARIEFARIAPPPAGPPQRAFCRLPADYRFSPPTALAELAPLRAPDSAAASGGDLPGKV